MLYEYTENNIVSLLKEVGTLEKEQIIRFFADTLMPSRCSYLLEKLTAERFLIYDAKRGWYSYSAAAKMDELVVKRRIHAFWVQANMGSKKIKQTHVLNWPRQFFMIDDEDYSYDITACTTVNEASIAKHEWDFSLVRNQIDDVNHIAVVNSRELGERLFDLGFDNYCIVNPLDHKVSYYTQD